MPKLNVLALRWLLLGANLVILTIVCWTAYSFLFGERDELNMDLPKAEAFEVKIGVKSGGTRQQLDKVLKVLYYTPPAPRVPVEDLNPIDQPPRQGGPLQDWQVMSVIVEGGTPYAVIKESVQKTSGIRPSRVRRGSRKSKARPKVNTRFLFIDSEFRVEGKLFWVESIGDGPPTVIYRDESDQRYTLIQEEKESRTLVRTENGTFVIDGLGPEELEDSPAPKKRVNPVNEDLKGQISGKKVTGKPDNSRSRPKKVNRKELEEAMKMLGKSGNQKEAQKLLDAVGKKKNRNQ
ncbi:MAG: hypothetical protein V3T77_09845 [Planctomycetota bacterium]